MNVNFGSDSGSDSFQIKMENYPNENPPDPNDNWGHLGNLLLKTRSEQKKVNKEEMGDDESFSVGLRRQQFVTITLPENANIHALIYKPWTQFAEFYDRNYDIEFRLFFKNDNGGELEESFTWILADDYSTKYV